MKSLRFFRWAGHVCTGLACTTLLTLTILHFFTREGPLRGCLLTGLMFLSGIRIMLLVFHLLLRRKHRYPSAASTETRVAHVLDLSVRIVMAICFITTLIQKEVLFGFGNGSEGYYALTAPLFWALPALAVDSYQA